MELKDVGHHGYVRLPAGAEDERSGGTPIAGKAAAESRATIADDEEVEEEETRGAWGNQCQFILTALGLSVGLGNIWRFPAVAYENGGSAFIIPYIICLVTFGLPMVYLEFYMGQHVRVAPALMFRRYAPILQGFGWGPAISGAAVAVYYTTVIGSSALYIVSVGEMDQWVTCRNESQYCVSKERTLQNNCSANTTFMDGNCVDFNSVNGSEMKRWQISAPEDYYQHVIMGKSDVHGDVWNFGDFNWRMAIVHTILWILILVIVVKGVKLMGYLSYVTVTLPYVSVAALFINGLFLEGAWDGLEYFWLNPNFKKLMDPQTWSAALCQLCFSLSIGYGCMMILASYCKKSDNCFRSALILCFGDLLMGLIGGGAMFSTLGYLAHETGVPKDKFGSVVQSGTGLAFVAIPQAIANMPKSIRWLWSTLFFLMIMSLGFCTEVVLVKMICSCIYDLYPKTRKHQWVVSFVICFTLFALGMVLMFSNSIYLFAIMNKYIGTFGTVFCVAWQAIVVAYFYGYKNANADIKEIFGEPRWTITKYVGPTSWYWQFNWLTLSPALAIVICLLILTGKTPTYGKEAYEFEFSTPMILIGWLLALSPLALVIPYAIYNVVKTARDGKPFMDVFRVQPDHPSYKRIHGLTPTDGARDDDDKFTKDTQELIADGQEQICSLLKSAATTTRQDESDAVNNSPIEE